MASIIDNLTTTLDQENTEYEKLLELSLKKTPVIVKGDLEQLQAITDEEQLVAGKINHLDRTRMDLMKEIAKILNMDVKNLKLKDIITVLEKRPVERQKLATVYDKLSATVHEMKRVNERNGQLIEDSLEMAQFEMNILQAMKSAPETANYNKGAFNDGSVIGASQGRFDAKQ